MAHIKWAEQKIEMHKMKMIAQRLKIKMHDNIGKHPACLAAESAWSCPMMAHHHGP